MIKEYRQHLADCDTKYFIMTGRRRLLHFKKPINFVLCAERKAFRWSSTPKGWKKFRTKGGFLADFLRTKSG